MTNKDKCALLEEILEVEEGTINEEMCLNEVNQWDSIAQISFISLMDDKFDRLVGHDEIKKCHTINDLLCMME
jgi:acyl carrier protein